MGRVCFRDSYMWGGGFVLSKEERRRGECNLFISHRRERQRKQCIKLSPTGNSHASVSLLCESASQCLLYVHENATCCVCSCPVARKLFSYIQHTKCYMRTVHRTSAIMRRGAAARALARNSERARTVATFPSRDVCLASTTPLCKV
jgi:hypothetical protein